MHPADLPRAGAGHQEVAGQGVHGAGDALSGEEKQEHLAAAALKKK